MVICAIISKYWTYHGIICTLLVPLMVKCWRIDSQLWWSASQIFTFFAEYWFHWWTSVLECILKCRGKNCITMKTMLVHFHPLAPRFHHDRGVHGWVRHGGGLAGGHGDDRRPIHPHRGERQHPGVSLLHCCWFDSHVKKILWREWMLSLSLKFSTPWTTNWCVDPHYSSVVNTWIDEIKRNLTFFRGNYKFFCR